MKNKKMKKNAVLILIITLAFFLRIYRINQVPPSLYWEEVALGYDAYSLLKTGKDHRGNHWPIAYLESYRDFKPPLYVYSLLPSISFFGLNEFGVRFPSVMFGVLTVVLVYLITKELFNSKISLMAACLTAINPWHLQFSRPAFEANLALFLISSAVLFFLKSFENKKVIIISAIFFAMSLYAYHGSRVFSPLLVVSLGIIFFKQLKTIWKQVAVSFLLGILIVLPLFKILGSKEISQRFQETSAFTTLDPVLESNFKIEKMGGGFVFRVIHHRFFGYAGVFVKKYLSHFNGSFLFVDGDENVRHSTKEFGLFYHWEMVTLGLGLIYLLKNIKNKKNQLILSWLFIAPIPGSLTKATPHALRMLLGMPAFIIVSALGLYRILIQIIKLKKSKKSFLLATAVFIVMIEFLIYFHFYHSHYPKIYSADWQYGYKQAVKEIQTRQKDYDCVFLTNNYGRAYMYYLFYTKMDPVQAQDQIKPFQNSVGVKQIGKVFIGRKPDKKGKTLFVSSAKDIQQGRILKTIKFLNEKEAFYIWEN